MATMIEDLVQPRAASTPAAPAPVEPRETTAAPATQASGGEGLPDEVLQIPAMQALFAGQPAALSASLADFAKRPEGKIIQSNKDALMQAGMSLYRALDGDTGVIFNQMYISGPEIQQADQAGQLASIAPPFDSVNQSIGQSGANNPVLKAAGPQGIKGAPVSAPPQGNSPIPTVTPFTNAAGRIAQRAREKNLMPTKPTEGPKPGAGRLLNSILKPVL